MKWIREQRGRRMLGLGVLLGGAMSGLAWGQGALPDPPSGFFWVSQGLTIYSDAGSFTVDVGHSTLPGTPSQTTLDESISLTAFDASSGATQHVVVHSSSYTASLSGLGSVVVINLDGAPATYNGTVGYGGWSIGGAGSAGPQGASLTNASMLLGPSSAALFTNGGTSSLNVALASNGVAPTAGGSLDFTFGGTYDINVSTASPVGQLFGSGSAFGNASVQTVYERFDLVAIPEPSAVLLAFSGMGLLLRRPRS